MSFVLTVFVSPVLGAFDLSLQSLICFFILFYELNCLSITEIWHVYFVFFPSLDWHSLPQCKGHTGERGWMKKDLREIFFEMIILPTVRLMIFGVKVRGIAHEIVV